MSRPMFSKEDKIQITQQWLEQFPSMGYYKSMWIGNILGPLFVGVHLDTDSSNNQYQPYIHISPLFCEFDYLPIGIKIKNGFEHISTLSTPDKYKKLANALHKLSIIPLDGDVSVKLLSDKIMHYCVGIKKTRSKLDFGEQERLDALKVLIPIAYWSEDQKLIDKTVRFARKDLSTFRQCWFTNEFGSYQDILNSIINDSSNLEVLHSNYERNIALFKMDSVPRRKLLY